MATLSEISVGDTVGWSIPKDPDPPSVVHGVITSINREEETANMRVWAILDDGSHEQTDRTVTQPISKLRIIKDFREEKQVSARIYIQPSNKSRTNQLQKMRDGIVKGKTSNIMSLYFLMSRTRIRSVKQLNDTESNSIITQITATGVAEEAINENVSLQYK